MKTSVVGRGDFGRRAGSRRGWWVGCMAGLGPCLTGAAQCNPEWQPLGAGLDGGGMGMAVHDGGLVVCGHFGMAGGLSSSGVARWDGSAWSGIGGSLGPNSVVHAVIDMGGALIAAGANLGTVGGVTGVAQWDGAAWQAIGGGLGPEVFALSEFGGELIAAGMMGTPGPQFVARRERGAWEGLGSGVQNVCFAVTNYEGLLAVGGTFTAAGSVPANHAAVWDGAAWHGLGAGTDARVLSLAVYNGELIAGTQYDVEAWDGSAWREIGLLGGSVVDAFALTVWNGG